MPNGILGASATALSGGGYDWLITNTAGVAAPLPLATCSNALITPGGLTVTVDTNTFGYVLFVVSQAASFVDITNPAAVPASSTGRAFNVSVWMCGAVCRNIAAT